VSRTVSPANRLPRRLTLLRARRTGSFDPDQVYQEGASRARIARRVRVALRRQDPVFLLAPRWSRPDRFLDELSADLLIGRPRITATVVPLAVVHGRPVHEVQGYLLRCVAEAAQLDVVGAAAQPVNREGFREILASLLGRTQGGPRRALLLQGVEHLDVDVVQDVYDTVLAHAADVGAARRFNVLFAGSVQLSRSRFPGLVHLVLPDFGPDEAVQALHEYAEQLPERDVELAASLVGGVPALLHAVGVAAEQSRKLPTTQEGVWNTLGVLADELRAAVVIVAADQAQAERLEAIARQGSLPVDPAVDGRLIRAGVIRGVPRARQPRVVVRAPILAQLAGTVLGGGGDEAGLLGED
jgi:hypothetical protein